MKAALHTQLCLEEWTNIGQKTTDMSGTTWLKRKMVYMATMYYNQERPIAAEKAICGNEATSVKPNTQNVLYELYLSPLIVGYATVCTLMYVLYENVFSPSNQSHDRYEMQENFFSSFCFDVQTCHNSANIVISISLSLKQTLH